VQFPPAMKTALLLLFALSVGGPLDTLQRPDSTKAPPRPPAGATAREPTARREKPPKATKPTGEPQLKRRKPPPRHPD